MDKKKVKELIREVIRNNVDNLSFGDDKHNAPLRKANGLLHDALIEIEKSDWVSVKDRLPDLDDSVLVRNENDPEDMWFAHRTDRNDVVVDKNSFAVGYNSEITHWQKIEV